MTVALLLPAGRVTVTFPAAGKTVLLTWYEKLSEAGLAVGPLASALTGHPNRSSAANMAASKYAVFMRIVSAGHAKRFSAPFAQYRSTRCKIP